MRDFTGQKNIVIRRPGWPLMYHYTGDYLNYLKNQQAMAEAKMPLLYTDVINTRPAKLYGRLSADGTLYGAWAEFEHNGQWNRMRNLELLSELVEQYARKVAQAGKGEAG